MKENLNNISLNNSLEIKCLYFQQDLKFPHSERNYACITGCVSKPIDKRFDYIEGFDPIRPFPFEGTWKGEFIPQIRQLYHAVQRSITKEIA